MFDVATRVKRRIERRIAASHLAGADLNDAIRVYRLALQRGWSCTFGPWTNPSDTSIVAARSYRNALQSILDNGMNCYLSVKLPAIGYDFSLLEDLIELADRKGIRIHFDGMAPDSAAPTLKIIERVLAKHRNIGYTIPARWNRSIEDLEQIIDFGIPVRLVKGQWTDPVTPISDVRKNFLAIVDRLAGKVPLVAIATHDRRLASEALHRLKNAGSPCEMEQLSSLPQNCTSLAKSLNVPMRLYIPYGYPSLPYNIHHVKARPAIIGWVIRDFFLGARKHLSAI